MGRIAARVAGALALVLGLAVIAEPEPAFDGRFERQGTASGLHSRGVSRLWSAELGVAFGY
jgi:hypothetical protein